MQILGPRFRTAFQDIHCIDHQFYLIIGRHVKVVMEGKGEETSKVRVVSGVWYMTS